MKSIIEIGFNKDGEADFSISGEVGSLSLDQMNSLRKIIIVGIGVTEDMFRRANEKQLQVGTENAQTYNVSAPKCKFP